MLAYSHVLFICTCIKVTQLQALDPLHSGIHRGVQSIQDLCIPFVVYFVSGPLRHSEMLLSSHPKLLYMAGMGHAASPDETHLSAVFLAYHAELVMLQCHQLCHQLCHQQCV